MHFLKIMFGSMLGFILGMILFVIVLFGMIAGAVSSVSEKKTVEVKEKSVLQLDLGMSVPERTPNNPLKFISMDGSSDMPVGLNDIIESINHAAKDENIKGIYINVESVGGGWATVEEIRQALLAFKQSKKWIIAYGEIYTKGAYYLASVADKIYLNPAGEVLFNGMYSEVTFFKGALEKLGVEMQVIRHGKFKGAVEPFFLDKLSPENREQINVYVSGLWNHMLERVSESRSITVPELNDIANGLLVRNASDAKKYKLVDEVIYKDELLAEMRTKLSLKEKDKINFIGIGKYRNSFEESGKGESKIAVIYAVGEINGGKGDDNSIGSEGLSDAIRKARLDEKVKAVVLRINSPGGSALASDVIWREVILTKKVKPVIVSMGDVAASGGYYIACGADSIFAQPNTITGSIGVFGLMPNTAKLMHEKLGITTDGVKTNTYSDLGKIDRPLSSDEMAIMQTYVNHTYDDFITKVADGRHMQKNMVDSIGQGRVWTGMDALKIGLVDKLGNLSDAIAAAARMAKLKEYKIKVLPRQNEPFEQLMKSLNQDGETYFAKKELGDYYTWFSQFKNMTQMKGVQARMFYWVEIK
ncbi:MAG: signal peptide peptidase SppA [Bacteroidetes bacterium]|nr:signal peptide peptidase SppA [Bacteroidota bacterium]